MKGGCAVQVMSKGFLKPVTEVQGRVPDFGLGSFDGKPLQGQNDL